MFLLLLLLLLFPFSSMSQSCWPPSNHLIKNNFLFTFLSSLASFLLSLSLFSFMFFVRFRCKGFNLSVLVDNLQTLHASRSSVSSIWQKIQNVMWLFLLLNVRTYVSRLLRSYYWGMPILRQTVHIRSNEISPFYVTVAILSRASRFEW